MIQRVNPVPTSSQTPRPQLHFLVEPAAQLAITLTLDATNIPMHIASLQRAPFRQSARPPQHPTSELDDLLACGESLDERLQASLSTESPAARGLGVSSLCIRGQTGQSDPESKRCWGRPPSSLWRVVGRRIRLRRRTHSYRKRAIRVVLEPTYK